LFEEGSAIAIDLPRRLLLREVNERIREVNGGFVLLGGTPDWVEVFCECGRTGCLERVRMPSGLYEEIRGLDEHFLVAPGHEHGEKVVADDRLYRVVVLNGSHENERDDPRLQPGPARLCTEAF
jgi:hypothetical protein